MVTLIIIDPNGEEHRVSAVAGQSVMEAAVDAMVPGIEASCGGNCVCATCHCYFDDVPGLQDAQPDETEAAMLECLSDPRSTSRLSCQVRVTEALDGARIQVADSQH